MGDHKDPVLKKPLNVWRLKKLCWKRELRRKVGAARDKSRLDNNVLWLQERDKCYTTNMHLPKPDFKAAKNFFETKHPVWGFILLLAMVAGMAFGWQAWFGERLLPQMIVGGVPVGRLSREEALSRVTARMKELENRGLRYVFNDRQVMLGADQGASSNLENSVSLFEFDPEETLNQAWALGHQENWAERWFSQLRSLLLPTNLPLVVQVNEAVLTAELKKTFSSFTAPPKNARFVWSPSKDGITVAPAVLGSGFVWEKLVRETEERLEQGQPVEIALSLVTLDPAVQEYNLLPLKQQALALSTGGPVAAVLGDQRWPVSLISLVGFFTADEQGKLALDAETVGIFLAKLNQVVAVPIIEARFELKDGRVTEFQPSQAGKEIDTLSTVADWQERLLSQGERTLPLILREVKPLVTTDNANEFGIRELIGAGKSQFAGSPKNRRHNIRVGASRLHGLLIPPDGEFSLLKALGPVDGAHGFLEELVIKGDRTIPEFGGGLCQIGTTSFRMALASGMPILERQNHSYRVVYYEPAGTDATIYNPKPDFRFKNDTGHYVLIQTKIQGDEAIFEMWGTKDGRVVEQTKPVVYNLVSPPPTKLIETTELPPGKKKCTERAHVGASAKFTYTVTYPNGEKKEKEFRSYYKPWQEVCLVGVGTTATSNQQPATNNN